jgi:predicted glycosyl hydrolase (DUF1957 family)
MTKTETVRQIRRKLKITISYTPNFARSLEDEVTASQMLISMFTLGLI